jgi:hypothetical protein
MKVINPNFIIIGAMKAATTSLYTYLKQHPDIFMTSIKEPKFFNNLNKDSRFKLQGKGLVKIKTLEQYQNLFKEAINEIAIGEASPSYIFDENCHILIKEILPKAKIIAILRQPVERAYSNFLHAKRADQEKNTDFEESFTEENKMLKKGIKTHYYLEKGFYYKQLKRYYDVFPKEQIKIILFEDIIKNPRKITQEVFKFLNVDSSFTPNTSKKANVSGVPKGMLGWIVMKIRKNHLMPNIEFSKIFPEFIVNLMLNTIYAKPKKISNKLINKLTNQYYIEDISKLEKLINKDLSIWM